MELSQLIESISGEGGVIALLAMFVVFLINGKVLPKSYVDDLKETNKTLIETTSEQAKSLDILARTTEESLENSRTALRILSEARKSTGVEGEDVSDEDK